jgi:hypothetical protein
MSSKNKVKFLGETLGLSPFKLRMKQALIAIRGEEDVPRTKADLSSLKQLHLKSIPLWLGKPNIKNKILISNLFNHTQTPILDGWSVAKTQTQDFRGKNLTYDSHNGTDFAIPVGTTVLTAAAGRVVRVISEYNRGGLKIFIDHGKGLMTCYAHLARSLVTVGQDLKSGMPIAISGYSGLDSLITFPLGIPHIHFNTWSNGEPVDPFKLSNGSSLWKNSKAEVIDINEERITCSELSIYDEVKLQEAIDSCITESTRDRINSIDDLYLRGAELIAEMNYYPTRFTKRINIYDKMYETKEVLNIPFSSVDFNGIVFIDEI